MCLKIEEAFVMLSLEEVAKTKIHWWKNGK